MKEEKSEGLLLQSIPYLGQQKILKIFTPDQGLLTLFAKSTTLTPFCLAEFIYLPTRKELLLLKDATLLDPLSHLREDYAALTAAGSLARDLLATQFPHKRAPELYALACLYLKKLPLSPANFAASFSLKLLLHEGLLSSQPEPAFTPVEWEQVALLAFARQCSQLAQLTEAPLQKIRHFFTERLSHQ